MARSPCTVVAVRLRIAAQHAHAVPWLAQLGDDLAPSAPVPPVTRMFIAHLERLCVAMAARECGHPVDCVLGRLLPARSARVLSRRHGNGVLIVAIQIRTRRGSGEYVVNYSPKRA